MSCLPHISYAQVAKSGWISVTIERYREHQLNLNANLYNEN